MKKVIFLSIFSIVCFSPFFASAKDLIEIFWTCQTEKNGIVYGGPENAEKIADQLGGITLSMWLRREKQPQPDDINGWRFESTAFAKCAKGIVFVIKGKDCNDDSIWEKYESPTLRNNSDVTRIIEIDPSDFSSQKVIFARP